MASSSTHRSLGQLLDAIGCTLRRLDRAGDPEKMLSWLHAFAGIGPIGILRIEEALANEAFRMPLDPNTAAAIAAIRAETKKSCSCERALDLATAYAQATVQDALKRHPEACPWSLIERALWQRLLGANNTIQTSIPDDPEMCDEGEDLASEFF